MKSLTQNRKLLPSLGIMFIISAFIILGAGYLYMKDERKRMFTIEYTNLDAIANLKTKQIRQWLIEREGDALIIRNSHGIGRQFDDFLRGKGERVDLLEWLESVCSHNGYLTATLIDPQKRIRLSYGTGGETMGVTSRELSIKALQNGEVHLSDLYSSDVINTPIIEILIPLFTSSVNNRLPVGVLFFRLDLSQYFYPLIQTWPTPSPTGESGLWKREGDDIICMNELRHLKASAFHIRFKKTENRYAIVKAINVGEGFVDGVDYRQVRVLAAVRKVPGTEWYLVAKKDLEEIQGPLKRQMWNIIIIVGLVIVIIGALLVVFWRQQRVKFFRSRYESELERQALVRHYDYLVKYANDMIFLYDQNDRLVEVNDQVCKKYGYTRDELLSMGIRDLRPAELQSKLTQDLHLLKERGSLLFETRHKRKNGSLFPVEVSAQYFEIEGKKFIQTIVRDLTERNQAAAALLKSEEKFSRIFHLSPDAIALSRLEDGVLFEVNEGFTNLYGYSLKELIGKSVTPSELGIWVIKEERDRFVQLLKKTGETINFEATCSKKDGTVFFGSISGKIMELDNIPHLLSITRDISERKRAEEVRQQSISLLEATLESTADGILVVDSSGKVSSFNSQFVKLWNIPRDVLKTNDDKLLLGAVLDQLKDPAAFIQKVEALYAHPDTSSFDVLHFKDGKTFERYSLPQRIDGRPVGRVWSFRDITERLRAEQDLKESESRFRRLYNEAPIGYHEIDAEGRIVSVNRTELTMLGYSPNEMIGKHVWEFIADTDVSRERVLAKLADKIMPTTGDERSYKRKDGTTIPVISDDRYLRDEKGKIIGIRTTIKDISDIKKAEADKKKLEAQLLQTQRMQTIGTLAAGIAHDFNNILNIIMGNASLLTDAPADAEKTAGRLRAITTATERGAQVVKQLLTFARKTEIHMQAIIVNDVIREISKLIEETFPKTIIVAMELESNLPATTADPNQLHQVLLNLSLNARDAMPSGGKITFKTSMISSDDIRKQFPNVQSKPYILISVGDTGFGMDEETTNRIFDPFFTTKDIGKGTGLGLSVVLGIINNHDGFVDVKSFRNAGTVFLIYLPVSERKKEEIEQSSTAIKSTPSGNETILFIEDEEFVREAIVELLKMKGYTILVADNGEAGVALFNTHKDSIQLVLSDQGLPKLNGVEVFKEIRKIRPRIAFILLTGYIEPVLKVELLKQGVFEIIMKPYKSTDLLLKTREALDQSKA